MSQSNARVLPCPAWAHASFALVLTIGLCAMAATVEAQEGEPAPPVNAGLHGAVTTQNGAVFLPGAVVTVLDRSGATVAETTSDGTGKYEVPNLKPGTYSVRAFLDGFTEALRKSVQIIAGRDSELSLDLVIARIAETVTVEGGKRDLPLTAAPAISVGTGTALEIGPIRGDNFEALLPTLPGIVRSPDGHISMKGGGATQSSVQINAANVTDPSTGTLGFDLPNDAVESVDVQTNPYAAEYGRFSSGVTTLSTARGGSSWSFTPNGFFPRFYREKDNWWNITGIRSFRPRFALGGPIVKDKVYLFENVLYRYVRTPVPSLPGDEYTRFSEVKTFSRLDVNVSPNNLFNVTVATFPRQVDFANLNTFNLSPVSTNFRQGGFNIAGTDRATLSNSKFLESTLAVKQYNVRVFGQGTADMNIGPEGNTGNYFNRQSRQSTTYQWVESLTMAFRGATGEHLVKLGSDLLQVSYDGTSASSPVNILRENGSLAERIVFGPMTRQRVSSTEAALVAQDHWRVNDRLLLEIGGRVDHDGVLGRTNVTPRLGGVIGLLPEGRTVLRGGLGLFYDRTPLNVGAFESFEPRTITQYAVDGVTPLSPAVTYVNRFGGNLQTPYGRIWNVELDHRVNDSLSLKVNHFERDGHHEFIVNPVVLGATPEIVLTTSGESRYRETEVGMRLAHGDHFETTVSYVRSHGVADLNNFDQFFGSARDPLIRPNEYGLINSDAPNRVLIRGSYLLPWKVQFDPMLDLRNGFPYSMIAEDQSYIGPRNVAGRYPTFASFDFSASRPVKIWKYRATVGVRLFDALGNFNPRDVQQNVASPLFRGFFNGVPRDFQTFVEFSRW
jgi:carboxypeptidase family protein/TonB-dependent receptor-like protein